jgi:hypothetical protein
VQCVNTVSVVRRNLLNIAHVNFRPVTFQQLYRRGPPNAPFALGRYRLFAAGEARPRRLIFPAWLPVFDFL